MRQGEILRLVEEFKNSYNNSSVRLQEASSGRSTLDSGKSDKVLGIYDIKQIKEALSINELDIEIFFNTSGIFPELLNIPVSFLDLEREEPIEITEPISDNSIHAYFISEGDENSAIYRLDEKEIEDFYKEQG